ncbi:hypothetical protein FBEOM_5458 [Fusarium beomiforme]|uniref:Uncharacterized protein n=1 Tax=Fusarium beomiforme TaxID=44412 RepID=A0A9P5AML3_9HYPO|nr:hypothetical protein FBEOM_5458 [Fusarium beomiforme]
MADHSNPSSSKESPAELKSDMSDKKTSVIETVPLDVLSYALSFVPNRESIRSVILSGPKLYNAFKQRQAYIASCVLFNTMEEPVYQEAIVTFNMKMAEWEGQKAGIEAINRVYSSEQRRIYRQFLTFDRVKEMWRLHKAVEYFAQRLPSTLILKHSVVKYKNAFSITPTVRIRFQRALYRLDAYLKVMELMVTSQLDDNQGLNRDPTEQEPKEAHWIHCLKELVEHRIMKTFQSQYSAVEVEQLSSITGLLVNEFAPSFNTFLERDIELGTQLPYYISHPMCPGSMSIIAQGIPFMKDFLTAGSRLLRAKFIRKINPPIDWNPHLPTRPPFPGNDEKLTCVVHDYEGEPGKWAKMDTPDFIMRTPLVKDPDPGPECAWHVLSRYAVFLNENGGEIYPFQSLPWGYVFWDIDMFEKAEFTHIRMEHHNEFGFTLPTTHPIHKHWNPLAKWNTNEATDRLLLSVQEKVHLMNHGQTGYFNFDSWILETEARLYQELDRMPREQLTEALSEVATPEALQQFLQTMEAQHPEIIQMAVDLQTAGVANTWVAGTLTEPPGPEDENEDGTN